MLGGADLFLQGLIVQDGGLGDFSAGDLRAVAIPGNPYPFAVGTMEVGSTDVAKTGLKGKGLKLLHHFPDQLWGLGEKSTPDPSFTPTRIFPQQVDAICLAQTDTVHNMKIFARDAYIVICAGAFTEVGKIRN